MEIAIIVAVIILTGCGWVIVDTYRPDFKMEKGTNRIKKGGESQ